MKINSDQKYNKFSHVSINISKYEGKEVLGKMYKKIKSPKCLNLNA